MSDDVPVRRVFIAPLDTDPPPLDQVAGEPWPSPWRELPALSIDLTEQAERWAEWQHGMSDVFAAFAPAVEQVVAAFKEWSASIVVNWKVLRIAMIEMGVYELTDDEREQAYRAHTSVINSTAGPRKVSWRRLNRPQRRVAELAWLERERKRERISG